MANFFKYSHSEEGKKSVSDPEIIPWYKKNSFSLSALFGVFILVTFIFFPRAASYKFAELKEGSISNEEIIAPFTFYVYKTDDQLETERKTAEQGVLSIFHQVDSVATNSVHQLEEIRRQLTPILLASTTDSTKIAKIRKLFSNSRIILSNDDLPFFTQLTRATTARGIKTPDIEKLDAYFEQIRQILIDLFSYGIINIPKQEIPGSDTDILVSTEKGEIEKPIGTIYEVESAKERMLERLRNQYGENNDFVSVGYALLDNFIQPNLIYDRKKTVQLIEDARDKVPLIKYRILKGQRIIDSHDPVEARHVEILRALSKEIVKHQAQASIFSLILVWFSKLILIVLTITPLVLFLFFQRRRIWNDRRFMFIIFGSMLSLIIISGVVLHYHYPKYLLPIAAIPMIITSYQDTRTGIFVGLSLSLLIGAQNGNDYEIALLGLLTTAAAIFALGFSKYRRKLANATIFIFAAYFVAIAVVGIIKYENFHAILVAWGSATIASVLSPMIAYSLIMLFDSVFDVTSEFKLMELSDLNNPLLKMFSIRSPGSYHHSLQVSYISEAAAEAIGANALLTKVGAYYHDIGKMFMPEYFVENQKGGKNPHDRLTPRLSSLILINHVRKGYEFAKENKIPSDVCNFIVEHHGSSLMQFFYEKAKEKAGDEDVLETDFRYPGTKPQSKETGILMLADAVEASVRSVKEPTLGKIRNVIRNIVDGKIRSGELDDCPLTLKDLAIIVETFSKVLIGIHHGRLEYPGQKELIKQAVKAGEI